MLGGAGVLESARRGGDDARSPTTTRPRAAQALPRPAVHTRFGVFRGTDPVQVRAFETWLGRDVDYVVDFSARAGWQDISNPRNQLASWRNSPYRQVYGLAMLPTDDGSATMQRGADGDYDGYFSTLARRLVAAGQQDAILRLGWEFNLGDSRWSTDEPQVFISYWQHVVSAMRAQPGQQFEFDWNPNNGENPYDATSYYPGDDVVDYIGVDAYDVSWRAGSYPYPEVCDQKCRLARQRTAWEKVIYGGERGLRFWSRFAAQHGKPLSLPEWGLWSRPDQHGGGEDAYYLRQMEQFIADPANDVAYQAYFEFNAPDGRHRLMTTFPASGEVFRALFGS
jgi:hypothetical protein